MSKIKKSTHFDLKTMALVGVLLAMQIVLARVLSISLWNLRIGFSFIPVFIAARKFGPMEAAVVAGLGDFLGAILFPVGPYFPGFTVTAVLMALSNGFFFHKKCTLGRISLSVIINQIGGSLLLNSLWLSILNRTPYVPLLATRVYQMVVMTVVQIVVAQLILIKSKNVLARLSAGA